MSWKFKNSNHFWNVLFSWNNFKAVVCHQHLSIKVLISSNCNSKHNFWWNVLNKISSWLDHPISNCTHGWCQPCGSILLLLAQYKGNNFKSNIKPMRQLDLLTHTDGEKVQRSQLEITNLQIRNIHKFKKKWEKLWKQRWQERTQKDKEGKKMKERKNLKN